MPVHKWQRSIRSRIDPASTSSENKSVDTRQPAVEKTGNIHCDTSG
ncbi:MAG: hypothetical protein HQM09_21750 [Candidatus Riflebacteria bacterium]|nr:hypothetical protein [Candidatus Riflebacteria bacterium]